MCMHVVAADALRICSTPGCPVLPAVVVARFVVVVLSSRADPSLLDYRALQIVVAGEVDIDVKDYPFAYITILKIMMILR